MAKKIDKERGNISIGSRVFKQDVDLFNYELRFKNNLN
jgi:hypothetical protein